MGNILALLEDVNHFFAWYRGNEVAAHQAHSNKASHGLDNDFAVFICVQGDNMQLLSDVGDDHHALPMLQYRKGIQMTRV